MKPTQNNLGTLLLTMVSISCRSLTPVTLPSYRVLHFSQPNAAFVEEHRTKYGCIGAAQRNLQEDTREKLEQRAKLDYAEHCQGNPSTVNYAFNDDVMIAHQPLE